MCRVLIVEDIDLIRKDIQEMIDWNAHGFTLVGEARNGRQGLLLFQETRPDIVLTDIRMPVMGGLEMIQKILSLAPETQFILLTAYEEFDYAKQAISLGITSYLLKHELDEKSLLGELQKIKDTLIYRRKVHQLTSADKIRKYLSTPASAAASDVNLSWNGLSGLFLVEIENNSEEVCLHFPDIEKQYPYEYYCLSTHLYLILFQIIPEKREMITKELARLFLEQFALSFSSLFSISIGLPVQTPSSLRDSYLKARQLLSLKVFFSGNCILDANIPGASLPALKSLAENQLKKIISFIEKQQFSSASAVIRKLYEETVPKMKDLDFYANATIAITNTVIHMKDPELPNNLIYELTSLSKDAAGLRASFVSVSLCRILDTIQETLIPKYSKKIVDAIQYIKEHYAEDITLQTLSQELGISPLYVSQLFKKEVGINLMTYITKYRISVSKELLKSGKYKIYEVSEMVGYQTVQYFSNSFKKETGKKPSDYC